MAGIEGGETIWLEDLKVGMRRQLCKQVTTADIEAFAEISTDHNPVHLDEDFARDTRFQGRIAHGMIAAGLVGAVLGQRIPGHGTIYLEQSLKFLAPVRPDDVVRAEAVVTHIHRARRRVTLETSAWVGATQVLTGEATVLAPSREEG